VTFSIPFDGSAPSEVALARVDRVAAALVVRRTA